MSAILESDLDLPAYQDITPIKVYCPAVNPSTGLPCEREARHPVGVLHAHHEFLDDRSDPEDVQPVLWADTDRLPADFTAVETLLAA